jgi:DNA-directed RNA polymerase subunit RPC12/RpoP
MSQAFNCPNCGAPLDYQGSDPIIRCPYCNSSVIVPENLRARPAFSSKSDNFTLSGIGDMGNLISQARRIKEVKDLAEAGEMERAVALYREITGQDEFSARQAVGKLSTGQPVTLTGFTAQDVAAQVKMSTRPTTVQVKPVDGRTANRLGCILGLGITVFVLGILAAVLIPTMGAVLGTFSAISAIQTSVPTQLSIPEVAEALATSLPQPSPTPGYGSADLQFGSEGLNPGMFTDARSIAISPKSGNIFVAEYMGGRVQAFDPSGEFITQWFLKTGEVGYDPIIFKVATDWSGNVYVVMNGDIFTFTEAGEPQNVIDEQFESFRDLVVAPDGNLYAYTDDSIYVMTPDGKTVAKMENLIYDVTGKPEMNARLALDGENNIYLLASGSKSAVFKFDSSGKYINRFGSDGDEPGQFRAPYSIAVDGQGRIFIGDFKGIQVFENDGRYIDLLGADIPGVPFGLSIDTDGRLLAVFNSAKVVRFLLKE